MVRGFLSYDRKKTEITIKYRYIEDEIVYKRNNPYLKSFLVFNH